MTLELHVIRDYNIHLQGHQYQIIQVIYEGRASCGMCITIPYYHNIPRNLIRYHFQATTLKMFASVIYLDFFLINV